MMNFLITYWGLLLFFATMVSIVAHGAWHALRHHHMGPFWIALGIATTIFVVAIVIAVVVEKPL